LRSAVWPCTLCAALLLLLLLLITDHRFSTTGSCCACAARVVEHSWLSAASPHTLLPTFILCDHAEFWSSKILADWSGCCKQVRCLQDNRDASKPGQQVQQLCLAVPATCSRLVCQHGFLFPCYVALSQIWDARFVPYPTEGKNAHLPLLQQFSTCIASLLLLFLGKVHEIPAHLFML
jgi:hypothetical protein